MVDSRALRSAKLLDTAPAVSSANGRSLQRKSPLISNKAEGANKRRGPPNVKALSPLSKTTENSRPSLSTAGKDANEDDEGVNEDADDDDDDDDNADVNAPPSDCNIPVKSIEETQVAETPNRQLRNSKHKSLAGLNRNINTEKKVVDESDVSPKVDISSSENDNSKLSLHAELSEENSDSEASNFEVADDDDDYDAVDNISNASDDSRDFEADIEREIQAAGEAGIDWDDENTYHYNNPLNDDIYNLAYGNSMAQSLYGLDIFAFERDLDARLTQSEPNLQNAADSGVQIDQAISQNMLKLDRSMASESEESSNGPEEQSKPTDKAKPALKMETSFDDEEEGDTTDEDIPWTTVSSPGVTLSRQNSNIRRRTTKPKKGSRIPPRKRLPMRKIPPHPNKAIAYSVAAPFGSTVRFCTPKAKSYRWMDLRGRHSRHSSGASSPTMINLQDAYTRGNTRTGAHITDVINGTLFSALHCRSDSVNGVTKNESTSSLSKFYQPLLKNETEEHPSKHQHDRLHRPIEESALALIDFSGGVVDEDLSEDEVMGDAGGQSALEASPEVFSMDADIPAISIANIASHVTGSLDPESPLAPTDALGLQVPITPPPEFDLTLAGDSSSPKKRRMSNRSHGRRSVSPAMKKQRYDGSNEVLV